MLLRKKRQVLLPSRLPLTKQSWLELKQKSCVSLSRNMLKRSQERKLRKPPKN